MTGGDPREGDCASLVLQAMDPDTLLEAADALDREGSPAPAAELRRYAILVAARHATDHEETP